MQVCQFVVLVHGENYGIGGCPIRIDGGWYVTRKRIEGFRFEWFIAQ
jgi:hypothetical protein